MRRVASGRMAALGVRTKLCGSLVVVCTALIVGTASPSFASAQTLPAAAANAQQGGEISPEGPYKEGLAVGPWMYYPSIFVGGTYNSNPNQARNRHQQGFRLERPRGSAPDRDRD